MGRGLWEKGCVKGTVGNGMLGGDCGKRDAGREMMIMLSTRSV